MNVVLSPDRKKYWDGSAWSDVVLLSEDQKSVWDGVQWHAITQGVRHTRSEKSAIAWSYAIAGAIVAPIIFIGSAIGANGGLKALIDALAALPLLGIHSLKDLLISGQFRPPSRATLLRPITHIHPDQWLLSVAAYGGLLFLLANVVGFIFALFFGMAGIYTAYLVALIIGFYLARRTTSHGWRIILLAGYGVGLLNSITSISLTQEGNSYASQVGGPVQAVLWGTFVGGTLYALLGGAGYFIGRRFHAVSAPKPLAAMVSPFSLAPPALSPDQAYFWDGHEWMPSAHSPDGYYVWNGSAWVPSLTPALSSTPVSPDPVSPTASPAQGPTAASS